MSHGPTFQPRRLVVGRFADSDALLTGTKQVREKGYKKIDTHSPYPIHGLEEALGLGRPKIPTVALCGAIAGICTAYAMMYFMNVVDFPINVANRPPHSIPAFVPITFELAVLLGGCSAFFGVLALMGFPQPYHPVFQSDVFVSRSVDGFFVSVELGHDDDADAAVAEVKAAGAREVDLVTELER